MSKRVCIFCKFIKEDKVRTEKLMKDLGDDHSDVKIVEVFKDDMLLCNYIKLNKINN